MTLPLRESSFNVPKMDCPSEERMIRLALDDIENVRNLSFDLERRVLRVVHADEVDAIAAKLATLGLGAELIGTSDALPEAGEIPDPAREARTLKILLAINALMFAVEVVTGIMARSAGLLADSLDMFADAAVYGLALYAVGRSARAKVRTAHFAGWLQAALAIGALVEVVRRFAFGNGPEPPLMMAIASIALIANVACLLLVSKHRDGGAHMKASVIFSANDVLANVGVILAGALVAWTGSPYPDLAIGAAIAFIVLRGALRILRLR